MKYIIYFIALLCMSCGSKQSYETLQKSEYTDYGYTMYQFVSTPKLVEEETVSQNGRLKTTYKFNKWGKLDLMVCTDLSSNQTTYEELHKFDENGKVVNITSMGINRYISIYNDKNQLVKETYKYQTSDCRSEYEWDDDGNLLSDISCFGDQCTGREFSYNEKGVLAQIKEWGTNGEVTVSFCDDKGNRIESVSQYGQMSYSYEYDEKNNWILRRKFINDNETESTTRTIVYY